MKARRPQLPGRQYISHPCHFPLPAWLAACLKPSKHTVEQPNMWPWLNVLALSLLLLVATLVTTGGGCP